MENGPLFGRGIAYGIESEVFRLNVPASRMSIDPEVPGDFVAFAEAHRCPDAFISRATYGRYVTARLGQAIRESPGKLRLWRDEAVAVSDGCVVLRGGRRLQADAILLATGLVPAGNLGIETDARGFVIDSSGAASTRLMAIGSTRRACEWETTAVTEISAHAMEAARRILGFEGRGA